MTHCTMLTVSVRRVRHAGRVLVLGFGVAAVVSASHAAVWRDAAGGIPGNDGLGPPLVRKGILERALYPETSVGNRNLDLLLDIRSSQSDAALDAARHAVPPAARRGPHAVAPAAPASAPVRAVLIPSTLMVTAPRDLSAGNAVTPPLANPTRDWLGGAPARSTAGAIGNNGNAVWASTGPIDPGRSAGEPKLPLIALLPHLWLDFIRENRYWFVAALGVAVLVGGAMQVRQRR